MESDIRASTTAQCYDLENNVLSVEDPYHNKIIQR